MTKKHFEMIAREFKNAIIRAENKEAVKYLELLAIDLSNQFKYVNPLFDKDRFLSACFVSGY